MKSGLVSTSYKTITTARKTIDSFANLALQRRSIRRYCDKPVDRPLLDAIIDSATRAPSNFNRQPWQFYVLDQADWTAAFNALLDRAVNAVEARDEGGDLFNFLDHVRQWLYPLKGAPVLILAFYKPSPERLDQQMANSLREDDVAHYNPNLISLGMAIQNLLLAAADNGLGACMHSGPLAFLRGSVNELLGLPKNLQLAGLISLGWPDEEKVAPRHKPLDNVRHYVEGPVPKSWEALWS